VAALALMASAPAQAMAACPDPVTVRAARFIEFQTMMMDVSLRCAHVGVTMADHLSAMYVANRAVFDGAHDQVELFFRKTEGTSAAPSARGRPVSRHGGMFEHYQTVVGNQYGAGTTSLDRCRAFDAIVISLGDKTKSGKMLNLVVDSMIRQTLLETTSGCLTAP
jgi:hypothetical protein